MCRTANGWDINGLGQQKDGRGNICPVTIIMPTLAMEAWEDYKHNNELVSEYHGKVMVGKECNNNTINFIFDESKGNVVDRFMQLLDKKIHEAKDMLIERFKYICNQSPESAKFMYENGLMAGYIPEEGIISALKHGTLAVG